MSPGELVSLHRERMYNMKQIIYSIAVLMLLMSCGTMTKVEKSTDQYYVAVGMATAKDHEIARTEARARALADMSNQIHVNVSTLTESQARHDIDYGKRKTTSRENTSTKMGAVTRSYNSLYGMEWEEYEKHKNGKWTYKVVLKMDREYADQLVGMDNGQLDKDFMSRLQQ